MVDDYKETNIRNIETILNSEGDGKFLLPVIQEKAPELARRLAQISADAVPGSFFLPVSIYSVRFFLLYQNINDWQNSNGVKDKDTYKPCQMIVMGCFPHRNQFPDSVPDCKNNNYREEPGEHRVNLLFHFMFILIVK
jgi:hypothetical protein